MSLINHIDLINGIDLHPIGLEAGNKITTTGWLMAIQNKINSLIDAGNGWLKESNAYTDDINAAIQKEIAEIQHLIDTGEIIKDGSIDFKKVNLNFMDTLEKLIIKKVHDSCKLVIFGLEGNNFVAYYPDTWDDLHFSTDVTGHLILEY